MLVPPHRRFPATPIARLSGRAYSFDWGDVCTSPVVLVRCIASVCLFAAALLFTNPARAQRIILLCPPEADTSLTEAFNRLRGELSMHGFEVVIQTSAEAISAEDLASRADSVAAVASVSFVRSAGGHATADIKISDRVTGKMTTRTIATPEGMDAASLLALRAVELLRASLREFGPTAKASKDIVGVAPDRASPSVREFAELKPPAPTEQSLPPRSAASTSPAAPSASAAPPAPAPAPAPAPPIPASMDTHWTLRADALVAGLFPGAHAAYGAGVTVGFRPSPRLEVQLAVEAPWFGTEYSTANATSEVHLFTTAGGLVLLAPVSRYAELQLTGGLGLTRMTLFTSTTQPVLPLLPSAWVLMPRLGAGVSVLLSPQFFWQTNVIIAAFLPRVRLHFDDLEDRAFTVGLPILQASSGFGMRF